MSFRGLPGPSPYPGRVAPVRLRRDVAGSGGEGRLWGPCRSSHLSTPVPRASRTRLGTPGLGSSNPPRSSTNLGSRVGVGMDRGSQGPWGTRCTLFGGGLQSPLAGTEDRCGHTTRVTDCTTRGGTARSVSTSESTSRVEGLRQGPSSGVTGSRPTHSPPTGPLRPTGLRVGSSPPRPRRPFLRRVSVGAPLPSRPPSPTRVNTES